MDTYRPRRQSPRWLDGDCPAAVLAIYDNGGTARRNGTVDRYTIMFVPTAEDYDERGYPSIHYLGTAADPRTFSGLDDMPWHQARAYRTRVSHHAARWSNLPPKVQDTIREIAAELTGAVPA